MMAKARRLNDQDLIRLLLKKMSDSGMLTSVGGCQIIPFPPIYNHRVHSEPEPPLWWILLKLTLLIPGSLTLLLLFSKYAFLPV